MKRGLEPSADSGRRHRRGENSDGGAVKHGKTLAGLHAFRHFYASWCINRRNDGGTRTARQGGSGATRPFLDRGMTMDVYGHLFPRGDESAELAAAELSLLG